MLREIFRFELKYRLRRPGVYLCFAAAFLFSFFSFAAGTLPVGDKQFLNSPATLAFFMAVTSMMMMLISSAIMGVPLYRDIEYNTRDYYLSYPITKAGYFWGRFLGSFFFVLLIAAAIPVAAWLGSLLGPVFHWQEASRYGPQHLSYYLHPYLTIAVPNLVFTSCLFFSLVAATRNVKVIYSSGIILFLGYMISNFVLHGSMNGTLINLSDPFAINPVRMETGNYTLTQKNTSLVSIHGSFLVNRILWPGIGLLVLLAIYIKFSFEKFFSGSQDRRTAPGSKSPAGAGRLPIPAAATRFTGNYHRQTLLTLTRIELLNIVRDNYFWIILSCGAIFLCFAFANTWGDFQIQNFPTSTALTWIFNDNFLFFVFIILIFYTGETLHREKTTRYAAMSDSLPPPDWVLGFSKLFSLLALAVFFALLPILLGIGVQLGKGYTRLDLPTYLTSFFAVTLPLFTAMVLFAYMLHTVLNNKFAALGIGIVVWVALFLLDDSGKMTYRLLLYSYTPSLRLSDMDGMGHMLGPVLWYKLYWSLCGGLFLVLAALFFNRGVSTSFRERRQLAAGRWNGKTKLIFTVLLAGFLATGSFIYYNVSYLNDYLTEAEGKQRRAISEQQMKHYESMPLPKIWKVRLVTDLFPEERRAVTTAWLTIVNRNRLPIDSVLLDGDNLSTYSLKYNGALLPYTSPLSFARGKFNWWRPRADDGGYRMYRFPHSLAPGDTAVVEISSVMAHEGFTNDLEAPSFLHNGMFFNGGMPGMGYDEGDELRRSDDRKYYHLPPKKYETIRHGDPRGTDNLSSGNGSDRYSLDITVSTSGDQTAVAPGALEKEWTENGRNYYHYVQDQPGMYSHIGVLTARYAVLRDTAKTAGGRVIPIRVLYHPDHSANLSRFVAAIRDGLDYYSRAYGPYPFAQLTLAESSVYAPGVASFPGLIVYSENYAWNAHFSAPGQYDYCYMTTAAMLAGQWWGQQVAPNHTVGSGVISDGLAEYSSLLLRKNMGGDEKARQALDQELGQYGWGKWISARRSESGREASLLNADQGYLEKNKTAIVLYGLSRLLGEDSLNAALREFQDRYAFRDHPPFAGSDDLYRVLQRHVPDSLRYYLSDSWEKTTVYDNKLLEVKTVPLGKGDQYRVTMKVSTGKFYTDSAGNEHPAAAMNDYIGIGVFGAATGGAGPGAGGGNTRTAPLYLAKHRFTAGEQIIKLIVHGKPGSAAIDPDRWLMDKNQGDNGKKIE